MADWLLTTVGELCRIKHGFAFKGEHFVKDGDLMVLSPGNFLPGGGFQLRDGKETFYEGEFPPEFLLDEGDLLIAMTDLKQDAPILGSTIRVPESGRYLHNQRLGLVTDIAEHVDSGFLYYLLNSDIARSWLRATATGSTVRHTAPERIYAADVRLPPIEEQAKIAASLEALDHMIENNRRRIEILEEMARLIYREWFVHFRFPGHQDVELIDSGRGPIPEGWQAAMLGDITSYISRGIAPKYDEDSPSLVINQRCIRDHRISLDVARRHIKKVPDEKFVRLGDVLVNSTGVGTLGRVAPVRVELDGTTVDSHVTIVRPSAEINIDYFAELMLYIEPLFESMGVGSTGQTELSRARVGEAQVAVAPRPIRDSYGDLVSPMSQLAVRLSRQNEVLAEARDLLLPRLISGEMDVSGLDLDLEPVA